MFMPPDRQAGSERLRLLGTDNPCFEWLHVVCSVSEEGELRPHFSIENLDCAVEIRYLLLVKRLQRSVMPVSQTYSTWLRGP